MWLKPSLPLQLGPRVAPREGAWLGLEDMRAQWAQLALGGSQASSGPQLSQGEGAAGEG